MRLFLALNFPSAVRAGWYEQTEPLRAAAAGAPVRWTSASQLHLTLVFLGEQPQTIVAPLAVAMDTVAQAREPLDLAVGGVGAFPNWRRPRVLWLGVEPSAPLAAVVSAVASASLALGLPGLDRAFHPHITLGRVDGRANEGAVRTLAGAAERVALRTTVRTDSIDIVSSTLAAGGARHDVLHAARLGASPPGASGRRLG